MLIEFRTKNFRSFRDEQVFSLSAYARLKDGLETHAVATGRSDAAFILKSAAVYGPNASGKSNLLRALQFMQAMVRQSGSVGGLSALQPQPFLFGQHEGSQPSFFEVTVLKKGIRYQYGFTLAKDRVLEEYLLAYVRNASQSWFDRQWNADAGRYDYKYGARFHGAKKIWEDATRPDALYLATAVALNSIQLKPVFDWFDKKLVIINELEILKANYTVKLLKQRADMREQILGMLAAADLGMDGIGIGQGKPGLQAIAGSHPAQAEAGGDPVLFRHQSGAGAVSLPITEESAGSRKFFSLLGPIVSTIDSDVTLCIDDLDSGLHPMLVRHIVESFHRLSTGSQLVFTTHCDSLLENDTNIGSGTPVLRRDQIWFVDKGGDLASRLYALSDYRVRKNESVRDGYWRGRFDAMPMVGEPAGEER